MTCPWARRDSFVLQENPWGDEEDLDCGVENVAVWERTHCDATRIVWRTTKTSVVDLRKIPDDADDVELHVVQRDEGYMVAYFWETERGGFSRHDLATELSRSDAVDKAMGVMKGGAAWPTREGRK